MTKTGKITGRTVSVPEGLAISGFVSIGITLAVSAAIAVALDSEKITWEQAGYWIMGMLFAASFIGGKFAYSALKRQRILVSCMAGMVYWGLLLCMTALLFGGQFEAVWEAAGMIVAGSGTAALIAGKTKSKHRKKGRGYC